MVKKVAKKKKQGDNKVKKKRLKAAEPATLEAPKAAPEPQAGKKRKAAEVAGKSTEETSAPKPQNPRELFVGGINRNQETEFIKAHFEKHGKIEVLHYPYNTYNRPMGFAFITYATDEGAQKALQENDTLFAGKKISVKIKEERPRKHKEEEAPTGAPKAATGGGNGGARRKDKKYKGKEPKGEPKEEPKGEPKEEPKGETKEEPKGEPKEDKEEEEKEEQVAGKKTGGKGKKKRRKAAGAVQQRVE